MIQIKYSCSCGKRILAPTTHFHQTKPCPRCQQAVKIPGFGEPSFLLLLCECGESIANYAPQCPKCHRSLPENLKPIPPTDWAQSASPAPSIPLPPPTSLPSPLLPKEPPVSQKSPEGFRAGIKMKIRCFCGKRMLVWTRDIGKEEMCPKCQHSVKIPPSTASNVLHFVCDCGTYISVREDLCVSCQKELKDSPTTLTKESRPPSEAKEPVSDSDTTDLSEVEKIDANKEKK